MADLVIGVRTPALISLADYLMVRVIQKHAKDLTFTMLRPGEPADTYSATLVLGTIPNELDPAPVTVLGALRSSAVRGVVCTDGPRNIHSSAGYTAGTQFVGNLMAPVSRTRVKSGTLDLSNLREANALEAFDGLPEQIASAERVVAPRSSPVVTYALSVGATVELEPVVDPSWPLRESHLGDASVARSGSTDVVTPGERDRSEGGAAPRIARLLRQAAYLGF